MFCIYENAPVKTCLCYSYLTRFFSPTNSLSSFVPKQFVYHIVYKYIASLRELYNYFNFHIFKRFARMDFGAQYLTFLQLYHSFYTINPCHFIRDSPGFSPWKVHKDLFSRIWMLSDHNEVKRHSKSLYYSRGHILGSSRLLFVFHQRRVLLQVIWQSSWQLHDVFDKFKLLQSVWDFISKGDHAKTYTRSCRSLVCRNWH